MTDDPAPLEPLSPDSLRIGPYQILREIGAGGMGSVYLAEVRPDADRDGPFGELPPPGTLVAVKAFHPHLVNASDFAGRFRREARIGASIQHENLVRTLDAGTGLLRGHETSYMAMEFVEGQTLRELIAELGRVPEELAVTIARQVGAGLAAIHTAQITHRDLKPENVIITSDHHVKLMDLGVAKVRDASIRLSLTGQFLGSVHYASPEQFRNPDGVDARTDLYALGVLLHEMLTGQNPFYHKDIQVVLRKTLNETPARVSTVLPELSPILDQLVWSLVQKDADARPQTAEAVLGVLQQGEESDWWRERGRAAFEHSGPRIERRMAVERETALVGRSSELESLGRIFASVARGERHVVLLEGEPGVGKSRLVDEFAAGLARDGHALGFAFGSCPPPGGGRPFQAFSEALLGELDGDDTETALAALLPTESPVHAFAALLEGRATAADQLSLDAVRSLFAAAFRALTEEQPLVLVIEDLHLGSENAISMFSYLARGDARTALMVVATFRPPVDGHPLQQLLQGARDARFHHHVLERLGPREVGELLRAALGSENLVQELGFRLIEKTEGNPFFILEVIRSLKHENLLKQRESGAWTLAGSKVQILVPDSVREMLHATLSRLPDEDRELLDLAAVQGMEFDPDLLAELLGLPRIALLKRLSQLERKERLIRSVGRRCRFDHHQLQETLYDDLMVGLREEYHALVGEALKRRLDGAGAEATGGEHLEVARHLLLGGRFEAAVPHVVPALRHALTTYATDAGTLIGTRFLDLEAGRADAEQRTQTLLFLAEFYEHEGHRANERDALERAREEAEKLDDEALLKRAEERRLALHFQLGEFAEAEEICRRTFRRATRDKDRWAAVAALGNLAGALRSRGMYDAAVNALRRSLTWVMDTKSKLRRCLLTTSLGVVQFHRGHMPSAQRLFLQARELAREFGLGDAPVVARVELADDDVRDRFAGLSRALGRYAESRIDAERTLLLASDASPRLREAAALLALGILAGYLDQVGDARAAFAAALAACRDEGNARFEGAVLQALGENAVGAGDTTRARSRFLEALELRRRIGYRPGVCETLLSLGQLAAIAGDVEGARPYLDEAGELAPVLEMPGIAALARATAALLYAREGRSERARQELDEASSALSGATSPLSVSSRAEGLYFAALAARALGDESRYESCMWQAYETIQEVAERMPREQRATFLKGRSPNKEIVTAVGGRTD